MRILLVLIVLHFSSFALAMPFLGGADGPSTPVKSTMLSTKAKISQSNRKYALHIGRESRYERGPNFNYIDRSPMSLHGTLKLAPIWAARLEVAQFFSKTGNATLSYHRHHLDVLGWIDWKPSTSLPIKPFLGLGAGAYRETLTTRFQSESSVNNSEASLLYGATGGLELTAGMFSFSGELRFLGGEVDPNPLASGLVRIGIIF